MKKAFFFLSLFVFSSVFTQDKTASENQILKKIEDEFLKANLSYNKKDTSLFNDFEELLISLAVTDLYTTEEKLSFYDILYQLILNVNTNLYAEEKIDNREYRRAVRFLPSVFYYLQKGNLPNLFKQFPNESIKVLPYMINNEQVKKYLVDYALENPKSFYSQIEEFNTIPDFNKILNLIVANDPQTWVKQVDKNPFLQDLAKKSESQLIKKVLDIKSRMGINSELYPLLDDIIKNYFNDTHEWDFAQNKFILTKKLLAAILDENAYARISAVNFIAKKGVWIMDEFFDYGEGSLSQFSNKEIFVLLVLTTETNSPNDIGAVMNYLKKFDDDKISESTIKLIPLVYLNDFLKKLYSENNEQKLKAILTNDAYQYVEFILDRKNERLKLMHEDWFKKPYNYEEEQKSIKKAKSEIIATTFQLNKSQLSLLSWARNINKIDSNINAIVQSAIGNRFIEYLAAYHPNIILKNRERLKSLPEFPEIINKLAYYSPNSVKSYLGSDNIISQEIKKSKQIVPQTLVQIFQKYGFNTKAYSLIYSIIQKNITIEEAHSLSQTQVPYLKKLMAITVQNNPAGIHSVAEEQNQISLKFIRNINDHPSPSHPHLADIRAFSAKEVYSLMVLGEEEIFQFAFNYCYNTFLQNLGETSFIDFLPKVNYFKYREFCTLLANFDKFEDLFYKNSTVASQDAFLEKLTKIDFSDVNCIEEAAILCEFINSCKHSDIQRKIQELIKSEYHQADIRKDQLALAVYSLLASNIGERALINKDWFVAKKQEFSKYSLSYINVEELKNRNNKIVEVCYFYNDDDGISSFNNYIGMFRKMPNWFIQDLGSYYFISSLQGNDYDIFANKPQNEVTGQQAIRDYLIYNRIEPSIVVHRGHSYHSQKTIDQMVGSPKFIFMGSCGGYYKISELLVRSPNAQILSTKQVGTMSINDPMLKSIRELLRTNQNLDWPKFWEEQELKLSGLKDFKMYVPPHKNNGALFVNAFFKVVGL